MEGGIRKLSRMPTSKERGPKRPLRRNGSSRAGVQQHLATAGAAQKNQPPASRPSTRNNKYVLLEERDRDERRVQIIEDRIRNEGRGPKWIIAAADSGGSGGASPPNPMKRGESKLRMTRVDGFNSTQGMSPRGKVWLVGAQETMQETNYCCTEV